MSTLEIGLVGVGPWGAHILRDLRTLNVTVHAAARSEASLARARSGGAASIVSSPTALPNSCAGFVVANRTVSHIDAIEDLLPRDLPIFVEKPLGIDVHRIQSLPARAHDLVFVMHKWRYHPGVVELARIAAAEEFGQVKGLRTLRLGWGAPRADVSSLWILAPHDLSIALAILGETPRVIAAMADSVSPDIDAAIAHLRTQSGVPFTLEVSSAHATLLRRVTLRCEEAICELDSSDYTTLVVRHFGSASAGTRKVGDEMPLLAELRAFVQHLRGGPAPVTSLADEANIVSAISDIEAIISQ